MYAFIYGQDAIRIEKNDKFFLFRRNVVTRGWICIEENLLKLRLIFYKKDAKIFTKSKI